MVMSLSSARRLWGRAFLTHEMEDGAQEALLLPYSQLVCKLQSQACRPVLLT